MHNIFKYTKHPCLKNWANHLWERQCPVFTKSCLPEHTDGFQGPKTTEKHIPFGINSFISSSLTQQMLTSHPYHRIWRRAGDPAPVSEGQGLLNYCAQQSAKASSSSYTQSTRARNKRAWKSRRKVSWPKPWSDIHHFHPHPILRNSSVWSYLSAREAGKCGLAVCPEGKEFGELTEVYTTASFNIINTFGLL